MIFRSAPKKEAFKASLANKTALKLIAGIQNFNQEEVLTMVRAAAAVDGVSAIDIAAAPSLIAAVLEAAQATQVAVIVSSVDPKQLAKAAEMGVDGLEIGNYDALYETGLFFTPDDVLRMTHDTLELLGERRADVLLSVTIPGHLSTESQVRLAKMLEALHVDVIQTEGSSRKLAAEPAIQELSTEEKAEITFHNTRLLAAATSLPLMTASGLTTGNLREAFLIGASAVGVGTSIRALKTEEAMADALRMMVAEIRTLFIVRNQVMPEHMLSMVS